MDCDKCGGVGHVWVEALKGTVRCECLEKQVRKLQLGFFYDEFPKFDTPLIRYLGRDLLLTDQPLTTLRPHVAGVLLKLYDEHKRVGAVTGQKIFDAWVSGDKDVKASFRPGSYDLLIILLGHADHPFGKVPGIIGDLVLQIIEARELVQRPTWVILRLPLVQVEGKYGANLYTKLQTFCQAAGK